VTTTTTGQSLTKQLFVTIIHIYESRQNIRWSDTHKFQQESPAVAREDVLQPIQFLLQYWP